MGNQFRYTVWDPWMIISQILTLQAVFYVSLGLWITGFSLLVDSPRSLDQIFSYTELQANKAGGKIVRLLNGADSAMLNSILFV